MKNLLLIDGNSIMNRAFYGIMGSKTLTTKDGMYTNAIYGFLAIMFKIMEDLNPDYMAVSFDLKGPTARHKLYNQYKANRHGMPQELADQMPIIKDVLNAMNIDVVEKEGYEGDDILGTLAKYGEKQGLKVTILSGDRDTFQLASDNITIRIPRTKAGKTETEDYDRKKVKEEYGLEPEKLIEVKGLQGDSSDNIPGVQGIGPKTAINLIQKYGTIENLYDTIEKCKDDLKGKQRENIVQGKESAFLSKKLGTIDDNLNNLAVEDWNKEEVLNIFEKLNFKRYIEKFNLLNNNKKENLSKIELDFKINFETSLESVAERINETKECIYYIETIESDNSDYIYKKNISSISFYDVEKKQAIFIKNPNMEVLKKIFEDKTIKKIGHEMNYDYILLSQNGIKMNNMVFDTAVGAYILKPTDGKYPIDKLIEDYLDINIEKYLVSHGIEEKTEQISLFDTIQIEKEQNVEMYRNALYVYAIYRLIDVFNKKLEETNQKQLFEQIDMPTIEVLADMQLNGMYAELNELEEFGQRLEKRLDELTKEIYDIVGEEFNIKSPKQLGAVLFEKLKLKAIKKTKSGYSTDSDVLEKLKNEHPIIEKILEYRQLAKLNSTYVEGLKPYINHKTGRIHSFFHQTITATGRISSTEPNLQNIPTRLEFGKQLRKVFKPAEGKIYIDADYSQIELRVLAHLSEDEHMIQAFKNNEDIHKQAASKVFGVPQEMVTKEQRSSAKAVNFGIVYGISEFGLGEQLGIGRKQAKEYIEQYLTEYAGVRKFMNDSVEIAKKQGYSTTLFGRRREIQELNSKNYMIRQFGERVAMNTPVQGTAADIMKIAMIKVFEELKKRNLKSRIILQVHDEMMIEAPISEKEEVKQLLKKCMESATSLKVPLIAEISEAYNWYDCK